VLLSGVCGSHAKKSREAAIAQGARGKVSASNFSNDQGALTGDTARNQKDDLASLALAFSTSKLEQGSALYKKKSNNGGEKMDISETALYKGKNYGELQKTGEGEN